MQHPAAAAATRLRRKQPRRACMCACMCMCARERTSERANWLSKVFFGAFGGRTATIGKIISLMKVEEQFTMTDSGGGSYATPHMNSI